MIEIILKSVKNKSEFFSQLEKVYTSDRRKVHLKCIFLDLTSDFVDEKVTIFEKNLTKDGSTQFKYEFLDDDIIRIRFHRAIRYGRRIDSTAIFYLIDEKNAAIFFTKKLDDNKVIQKNLLKLMYPFWRRIIITGDILTEIEKILNREFEITHVIPRYDGWEDIRERWKYVSLDIPLGPLGLKLRIFQDGTVGLMTGSINNFLSLFSKAILNQKNETKSIYKIKPIKFSNIGIPEGQSLQLEFTEPFLEEELHQIIDFLSKDFEERFHSTTIHGGNPFLQLNIFDPKTGSLFVLIAIRNIIRISASNNFSVTSLRALIDSIHSSVGKPKYIKPVPV
ncbi:MAG: hypothetical protein ACFFAU_18475 [Candidatus Hodarchaeota archaeon]